MSDEVPAKAKTDYEVGEGGVRANAIGFVSSTVIGVASTAPGYSLAAVLGFVVAAGAGCGLKLVAFRYAGDPGFAGGALLFVTAGHIASDIPAPDTEMGGAFHRALKQLGVVMVLGGPCAPVQLFLCH